MKRLLTLAMLGLFSDGALAKEMSAKDLTREILELKSYAAEGRLVLRNYQDGKVTPKFVQIHSQKVADALKDSEKKLEKPARGDAEAKRKQVQALAQKLRADFQQIQKSPGDSGRNEALATEFEKIYRALEELAGA